MTASANAPSQPYLSSSIAGTVLPIRRAEELLATLPGVIAARIIAGATGEVDEIHCLTTTEYTPKQTVRNVESALIAHLGMRVDHRKISVATSAEAPKPPAASAAPEPAVQSTTARAAAPAAPVEEVARRVLYFEDVEVQRSRLKGVTCRVTLRKGDEVLVGEAEGPESDRSRIDLAARATLTAISASDDALRGFALEGTKLVDAFERSFVFVGVSARYGRNTALLTGSCEIKESAETASALAVLDATNRWIAPGR
ncbi:MAG: hypothetical protein AVDCRST_MAG11-114 [uncultured Gemmatimonadaceae bacterium]|uniref:Uncharacterized protein n=1 Tax=uncultured Gemmatimonadaceae bacterium TaxID=246130 RepID=A0A6J4JZ76_9BACT|nr:MAG: hypothetical protein AVDCRST_MAG11-114 [uncultured Gemmatimonadaceae bacterium]